MLLVRGADINAADKKGYTSLLIAVERGHTQVAKV
jgi:ankyrin repeat protein